GGGGRSHCNSSITTSTSAIGLDGFATTSKANANLYLESGSPFGRGVPGHGLDRDRRARDGADATDHARPRARASDVPARWRRGTHGSDRDSRRPSPEQSVQIFSRIDVAAGGAI